MVRSYGNATFWRVTNSGDSVIFSVSYVYIGYNNNDDIDDCNNNNDNDDDNELSRKIFRSTTKD